MVIIYTTTCMCGTTRKKEVCHTYCSFVTQWSSFRPLGEVVGGGDDAYLLPRGVSGSGPTNTI